MNTDMRTVTLSMCVALLTVAGGCASQAEAGRDLGPIAGAAPLDAASATTEAPAPPPTVAPALIDHCLEYVPFAAFTGNFYMQAIWNEANQDVAQLREVCEQMGHDDPDGLGRIATEHRAVQEFLAAASKSAVAPVVCAPGSVLGDDGFCVADR
jgi:hypothetical protein